MEKEKSKSPSHPADRGQAAGLHETFRRMAQAIALAAGSPWCFMIALLIIAVWGVMGPGFNFSDTWQLVINTSTTIITFLMVFLIQNTQNRETRAIQLKLDELLRGVKGARTGLVCLEELTDTELDKLQQEMHRLARRRKDETKLDQAQPPEPENE